MHAYSTLRAAAPAAVPTHVQPRDHQAQSVQPSAALRATGSKHPVADRLERADRTERGRSPTVRACIWQDTLVPAAKASVQHVEYHLQPQASPEAHPRGA